MKEISFQRPLWLKQMEEAFKAKIRGFILTFNIYDYVPSDQSLCRLRHFLSYYFKQKGYDLVIYYSRSTGFQIYDDFEDPRKSQERKNLFEKLSGLRLSQKNSSSGENLQQTLSGLSRLLKQEKIPCLLIIDYAHHLAPSNQGMPALSSPEEIYALETLHSFGVDERIKATKNFVILLGFEGCLNELLASRESGYKVIKVDLPSEEQRLWFIQKILDLREKGREEFGSLSKEITPKNLARITSGLKLIDLEELFRLASVRKKPVSLQSVREVKAQAIKTMCKDLLEVFEPNHGFSEVAGLDHVIDYLNGLTFRLKEGCRDVPRAILFCGVPGVGKTFIVKAWAFELSWNCLAMRNIRSKWVGESERNLERVFNTLQALQPALVFIDEIDQALGKRGQGGDSGVSERMLARIWEFTSLEENRGKIIWIGASNRPDLLDPATIDRFGVVIPFLHPTKKELIELFPILARQLGRRLAEDVRLDEIIKIPSLSCVTSRSLLEILNMAGHWADQDKGKIGSEIDHEHLIAACKDYKPDFNPLQHEFIALTALQMTSFNSLLPWRKRQGLRKGAEIPSYLNGIVDEKTGEIDPLKLSERLKELSSKLQMESFSKRF